MRATRAVLFGIAVSACVFAADSFASDKRLNERDPGGDGYHDEGHVYIDNLVGDPNIKLTISNSVQDEDTSAVNPRGLFVPYNETGTIAYGVRKEADDCTENNLKVAICAAPASMTGAPDCDSSKTKCASGEISAECYIGTGVVEYCQGTLICDSWGNCSLRNLPGGFSFKQGNTGKNHITFKISRN